MSAETPQQNPRQAFMKASGFILYNHVQELLLDKLSDLEIPRLEEYTEELQEATAAEGTYHGSVYPSMLSLYGTSSIYRSQIPKGRPTLGPKAADIFGLSETELIEVDSHNYDDGLDELNFPWTFAPALAACTVHSFVRNGELSEDVARKLSLREWGNIIASGWFGELHHTLARTGFGVYEQYGRRLSSFKPIALRALINNSAANYGESPITSGDPLIVKTDSSKSGLDALRAEIAPEYKGLLKNLRRNSLHLRRTGDGTRIKIPSDGCPVSRKSAMLPTDYEDKMPRATQLQSMGRLSISESPGSNGLFLATQQKSAIDRTLEFIADQLIAFEEYYTESAVKAAVSSIKLIDR